MSKFNQEYICTTSTPPVAFKDELVNVRPDGNRFVVTNPVTGHTGILCKRDLQDRFEKHGKDTGLINLGVC